MCALLTNNLNMLAVHCSLLRVTHSNKTTDNVELVGASQRYPKWVLTKTHTRILSIVLHLAGTSFLLPMLEK